MNEKNENAGSESDGTPDGGPDGTEAADDGLSGLLEGEANENDPDEGDGSEGAAGGNQLDVDAIVAQLEQRLGDRFDAIADRRVNAVLKEIRKTEGDPAPAKTEGGAPKQTTADERGVRLAFREYVNDEVKFIDADERSFAMDLGNALIVQKAGSGEDDEVLGRAVAKDVATRVKNLRAMYERRTVEALRKRGALVEKPGQPSKTPAKVGGGSEFQKGAELAKQMFSPSES